MRAVKRLISRRNLAEVPKNRSVKRVQWKEVGPALNGLRQRLTRVLEALQLIVGEGEVVLHLRLLWSQFRGALQRLQGFLELAVLALENS